MYTVWQLKGGSSPLLALGNHIHVGDCKSQMRLYPFVGLLLVAGVAQPQTTPARVDFLKDVQPVLTAKCLGCHSGDNAQAGLKAHTRDDLMRGGKSGPAIVPGKGAESLLVLKVEGKKGLRMPPSGPPLPPETIAVIRGWIDQGAKFDGAAEISERIAPLAPRNPQVPAGSAANPVDRFIDAYFAKKGVAAGGTVSDAMFARRVSFDVTGLPPTPEELDSFVRDKSTGKRAKLVDRLLDDREDYAEHWISFWNDLLRNDEGVIYHGERKTITDWLLASLEKNLPYNLMVRSLLNPAKKTDPKGFLVGVTWRGVVSASQSPPMQAAQNAGQVFLGINLKCAACHDSFINRWKLRDTYGLASMFSDEKLELVRCDIKLGQTAEPSFPFPELKVSFDETLESRRKAAAKWFTSPDNGRFARTIVNRFWKELMGRGIVEPADDMDAEPWDQDLLDWLASDFVAHGYDLQHLMRTIMTSRAYQMEAAAEKAVDKDHVFRGPRLRRLTAEQFEDTISAVTGDWRVNSPRAKTYAHYTREWQLKSDPLSRSLGRPIRDQVYTERSTQATTLQALELTNGPLLSKRLERGSLALLGELRPAPANLFDSKMMRGGSAAIDIDISGAKELRLMLVDVDSYDPARVIAGWADAELVGREGTVKLSTLPASAPIDSREVKLKDTTVQAMVGKVPSMLVWNIEGKGYKRLRAQAVIDERSRQSDISPAVRFFVFTSEPDPDELIRIEGEAPSKPPHKAWESAELVDRLYAHLLSRKPTEAERQTAAGILGNKVTPAGVEDLLWALLMSPEFQYIH